MYVGWFDDERITVDVFTDELVDVEFNIDELDVDDIFDFLLFQKSIICWRMYGINWRLRIPGVRQTARANKNND